MAHSCHNTLMHIEYYSKMFIIKVDVAISRYSKRCSVKFAKSIFLCATIRRHCSIMILHKYLCVATCTYAVYFSAETDKVHTEATIAKPYEFPYKIHDKFDI